MTAAIRFESSACVACGCVVVGVAGDPPGRCGDCRAELGANWVPPAALPDDVELSEVSGCYANRECADESAWDWDDAREAARDLKADETDSVNR